MIGNILTKFEKIYRADFFQGNDLKMFRYVFIHSFFKKKTFKRNVEAEKSPTLRKC